MSEMVERVAKAMAETLLQDTPPTPPVDWYALTEEVADEYRAAARAAIEAMREPTKAMEDGARGLGAYHGGGSADVVWVSMIDMALK
jgi:hypothetical protein